MFNKAIALALLAIGTALTGCERQQADQGITSINGQSLQCHKDTDCKGDRICESGICVNPVSTSPDISPQDNSMAASSAPSEPSPAAIPKFKDYPAGALYTGPTATLADTKDDFRTRNSNALSENKIVFASEYVISTIGCGTGCVFQSFLSKRTGEQLEDSFGGEGGEKIKEVRVNSKLVVTAGPNHENENDPNFYAYFYVLENERLRRIAKVQTTLPECQGTDYCTVDTVFFD
ncbi:MAG: hypothetical protein KA144_12075 [Xanthomonadaceae bacterium]|nr:hypothetical protein [Xanthomonadaceae bacterium]